MVKMVETYYTDLVRYAPLSLVAFFNLVRAIPYCVEMGDYQNLQRPGYTMNGHGPFTACANKAIAIAAFLRLKGYPYRFQIVSDSPDEPYHHVFAEGMVNGQWYTMDATYPTNTFGTSENWAQELTVNP